MRHIFKYIILALFFTSCTTGENPKVEIYLTKETIKNSTGIPIEEYAENHPNKKDEILEYYGNKNFSVDTINGNIICCSKFKVKRNDLEEKPFITDKEIEGFNFQNSSILISKSAVKKLLELPSPSNKSKQQFSICINGEPKLNGYFLTVVSKYLPENYSFSYTYAFDKNNLKFDNYEFWLRYGNQIRELDSINEKEFYEAMKISDRIIK